MSNKRSVFEILAVSIFSNVPGILFYFGRPIAGLLVTIVIAICVLSFLLLGMTTGLGFLVENSVWVNLAFAAFAALTGFAFIRPRRAGSFWARWYVAILAPMAISIVCIILVRTFIAQPFSIPAGSMYPTLQVGDYVAAKKYAYGYSKHSLPYSLKLFDGRVFSKMPQRGDIAVFKDPNGSRFDFVKRILGLPGDTVQMIDGKLIVNGQGANYEFLGPDNGQHIKGRLFREMLPSGVSYSVLDINTDALGDNTPLFRVPEAHIFVLGDSRDNSADSRFGLGYIPMENLVGRVDDVLWRDE